MIDKKPPETILILSRTWVVYILASPVEYKSHIYKEYIDELDRRDKDVAYFSINIEVKVKRYPSELIVRFNSMIWFD